MSLATFASERFGQSPFGGSPDSMDLPIALTLFALLVVLLFPLREHLPDLWAAVMLKVHQVQQVMMDGTVMQVRQIGWLVTTLQAGERELTRRNREVLQAFLQRVS